MDSHRQTMLMNKWFNFYGAVLCVVDSVLMILGVEVIILSIVNDFNSTILSDISYHYHYGMSFAGAVIFIASLSGFAGFLRESLGKLTLSCSLMIFAVLLLIQIVYISVAYKQELSLLANSDAEQSFVYYFQNKSNEMHKRRTESVMKTFDCCGWNKVQQMLINDTLPCFCCDGSLINDTNNKFCNDSVVSQNYDSPYICKIKSISLKNRTCERQVKESFEEDLIWIITLIIITILMAIVSTFLTFHLSNDLLVTT